MNSKNGFKNLEIAKDRKMHKLNIDHAQPLMLLLYFILFIQLHLIIFNFIQFCFISFNFIYFMYGSLFTFIFNFNIIFIYILFYFTTTINATTLFFI